MLVNVVGSFIIGFVGTLTGPDGRFLVAPDVRTFVMVGFCGGYTTFSSFSLQTLTLAYEGEWLEVGGNILLSVALCLLSVWLGHLAASSLNELQGA
jgi:CrcB protein